MVTTSKFGYKGETYNSDRNAADKKKREKPSVVIIGPLLCKRMIGTNQGPQMGRLLLFPNHISC